MYIIYILHIRNQINPYKCTTNHNKVCHGQCQECNNCLRNHNCGVIMKIVADTGLR